MNEENAVREAPRKKKRSLWWLWLLIMLVCFGGGVILGLKLNTLPLPTEVKARLYPVLESYIPGSTVMRGDDGTVIAPAPTPQLTPAPTPEATAEPAAAPAPELAGEPPEETAVPDKNLTPEQTAETLETAAVFNVSEGASNAAEKAGTENKYVGVGAALETALEHAGVEEKDAEVSGVLRAKDEDGCTVYNVSFKSGDFSYAYVIDAVSGDVAGWTKSGFSYAESMTYAASFAGDALTEAEAAEPVQPQNEVTAPAQELTAAEPLPEALAAETAKEKIGEERAKEIALEHAGVKQEEIRRSDAHMEIEHGVEHYDVDFYTANGKYEYEIDAYSGEILSFEQER